MERLIRITFGRVADLNPAAPSKSMNEVRNACAHPPSLAGDQVTVAGGASFDAIWRFALIEPVEFVLLLARSSNRE